MEFNRAVIRFCRVLISGANDLSSAEASASKKAEVGLGPMVASSLGVDFRSASKLSPADYGYIFVQTAFVEVLDE